MLPTTLHTTATARVKALDFSEDGSGLLAVGLHNGEVHVVAADDGAPHCMFLTQQARLPVRAVKFIPDAAAPLDLSRPGFGPASAPVGMPPPACPADGNEGTAPSSTTTAPCHLAAGCDDMNVYIYDVHGDGVLRTVKAHDDYIRSIALDPASPFLVTTSDDMTARVWSRSLDLHGTLEGHNHYVMAAAVATLSHRATPDGTSRTSTALVATGSLDNTVMLWLVSDGHAPISEPGPVCVLEGHTRGVNTVAFVRPSLERLFVVSGADDHEIRVWDAATLYCVAVLVGHTSNVSAVLCYQRAAGSLVSVGENHRVILWALSDTNDRTWCASAFEDVVSTEQEDAATNEAGARPETETSGSANDDIVLGAAFKHRAVRDKTDVMYAPSTAISGRGRALAATARDGQVLVAIGTDNGFDVSVQGTVPPAPARVLPSRGGCSELVVGSCPDVVDRFHFDDDERNDCSPLHDSSVDGGGDSDDEYRPLRLDSSQEAAGRPAPSFCTKLQRASSTAKIAIAIACVLSVLSVVIPVFLCVATALNPDLYLYGALVFAFYAFIATAIVAIEESNTLSADGVNACPGSFVQLFIGTLSPLSLLHLLPTTLRRLVNKSKPHNVVSGRYATTFGSRLFARGLALRPWWRWVTTTAVAKPFGRVASTASCALLPVHVAFVYALPHISDKLYRKDCPTPACAEERKALGSSSLVFANAVFVLFYGVSAALYVPALVPVPRAALFVLCAMVFDYATWVEIAVSPAGTLAAVAWLIVCVMVFIAATIFALCAMVIVHSKFHRHQPQPLLVNIGLAILGMIVVLAGILLSVLLAVGFCAALLSPILLLCATGGFAAFSTLRARAMLHTFCEEGVPVAAGSPLNRTASMTVAQRTATLLKVYEAQTAAASASASASVDDPVHFPPPPTALFGRKKRVTCCHPGARFFTSDPEEEGQGADAPCTVSVPESNATVIDSWDPVAQFYGVAAAAFDDDGLRQGPVPAPRWVAVSPYFSVVWDLVWFASRVSRAVVMADRRRQVFVENKAALLMTMVLAPLRLLFIAVVVVVTLATAPRSGNNSAFVQLLCLAVRAVMAVGMVFTSAAFLRFAARHVFFLTRKDTGVNKVSMEWRAVIAATREPSSVIVRHAVPGRVVPTVVAMWYVAPFIAPTDIRQ